MRYPSSTTGPAEMKKWWFVGGLYNNIMHEICNLQLGGMYIQYLCKL